MVWGRLLNYSSNTVYNLYEIMALFISIGVAVISPDPVVFDQTVLPFKSKQLCSIGVKIDFDDIDSMPNDISEIILSVSSVFPKIYRFANGKGDLPLGNVKWRNGDTKNFTFDIFQVSKINNASHVPIPLFVTGVTTDAPNNARFENRSKTFFFNT